MGNHTSKTKKRRGKLTNDNTYQFLYPPQNGRNAKSERDSYGVIAPQKTTAIKRSASIVTSKSGIYNIPTEPNEDTISYQFYDGKSMWKTGNVTRTDNLQENRITAILNPGYFRLRRPSSYHHINRRKDSQIHSWTDHHEMDIKNLQLPIAQVRNSEGCGNTTRIHRSVSMYILHDTPRDTNMAYSFQAGRKQNKEGNLALILPSKSIQRSNTQRSIPSNEFQRDAELETGQKTLWNIDRLYEPAEEFYEMNRESSGLCVIFNMETVGNTSRCGTDVDVRRLQNSFGKLGFDVEVKHNPSRREINDYMNVVKSASHNRKDSFACVLLSHGRDGHIRSSANEDVPLLEIIEPVKTCESLIGKPKLFFVQACRGTKTDNGMLTDAIEDINSDNLRKLSSHSDVLVSYATIEDFVAYRNGHDGSIYIKILCYLLDHEGFSTKMTDILNKVNRITVNAFDKSSVCQVPSYTSTLRKSLLFCQKKKIEKKTSYYRNGQVVKKTYYYNDRTRHVVNVENAYTENDDETSSDSGPEYV